MEVRKRCEREAREDRTRKEERNLVHLAGTLHCVRGSLIS